MNKLELPPLELLNHLFEIDENSPSGLIWKNPRSKGLKKGQRVGNQNADGYWHVTVKTDKSRVYKVHRIIFYMKTGEDPGPLDIDHINRNKNQNLLIRESTRSQNLMNTSKKLTFKNQKSSSIYKGVSWHKKHKKWTARITINKVTKNLGTFDSEIEAAKTYNEAALKYFKEFAVLNIFE